MTAASSYDHTQTGRLHYLLWGLGIALAVGGLAQHAGDMKVILISAGTIFLALTPLFSSLRVRDVGESLRLNFGPLPLIRRSIPYSRIIAVQPGRSRLLDGLGIHGIPGRRWTWNIWGRECVTLTLRDHNTGKDTTLNVGTDERDVLAQFLIKRLDDRLPPLEARDEA